MDEQKYEKIKNCVKRFAKKYNLSEEDIEEITQEHFLGKYSRPIKFVVFDYLRKYSSDKRTSSYTPRWKFRSFDDPDKAPRNIATRNSGIELEDGGIDDRFLKGLERYEKAVLLLKNVWDFQEKEIGKLFGVTESRVNQWLAGIYSRLRNRINYAQARELQKTFQKNGREMETRENFEMETIQPREMVLNYETGFDKWLT